MEGGSCRICQNLPASRFSKQLFLTINVFSNSVFLFSPQVAGLVPGVYYSIIFHDTTPHCLIITFSDTPYFCMDSVYYLYYHKELPLTFLVKTGVLSTNSLNFCLFGNVFILLSSLKKFFADSWLTNFFFLHFKHAILLPSGLHS